MRARRSDAERGGARSLRAPPRSEAIRNTASSNNKAAATASRAAGKKPLRRQGGVSAFALYAVAAFAPLPFGANAPVPLAGFCIVLAVGLACAPLRPVTVRQGLLLAAIAMLAVAIGCVAYAQDAQGWGADTVWAEAARDLDRPLSAIVAVVRRQSVFGAGNVACCLATVSLAILVGADRHRARRVLEVVAWSNAAYAALGILNALVDPTVVLWRERGDYVGAVLGPFINRNTAAVYFACGAILWAALLGELLLDARDGPVGELRRRTFDLATRCLGAAICLAATLMTESRAGALLALLGLGGIAATLLWPLIGTIPARIRTGLFVAAGGIGVIALFGGTTGQRFQSLGFADEGRFPVYRATLRLIAEHPWLGTGLGTFAWIYPTYRSPEPGMRNIWDKAHSTPLELAAEMGVPIAVLVSVCALGALAILAYGAGTRRRDRVIPLAAAAAFGIVALHSCIDFSLQIPGLAMVAMALLGAGLAQSFATERRPSHQDSSSTEGTALRSNSVGVVPLRPVT